MTLRATEIGCLILSRQATLPQLAFSSIIDASSVTNPSLSGLAPKPTQQFISFSVTITPCSTASSARPLFFKTFHAALLARIPASQVDKTIGFLLAYLGAKPAREKLPKPRLPTCKNFLLENMRR